jgi:hypothetical protein
MNTSAIFFDNDSKHIQEVEQCRNITCIKVPGIDGMPPEVGFMEMSDDEFSDHLGDASGNMINFLLWANDGERDRFDSTSGMTVEHQGILQRWLEESSNTPERWAIFDFDRTISKIEGFGSAVGGITGINRKFKAQKEGLPITAEEYMIYLCGKSRLSLLKNMFGLCIRNGVQIVILTNNGACITDPQIIVDFMNVLDVPEFTLICSRKYRSDKSRALYAELMVACPSLF